MFHKFRHGTWLATGHMSPLCQVKAPGDENEILVVKQVEIIDQGDNIMVTTEDNIKYNLMDLKLHCGNETRMELMLMTDILISSAFTLEYTPFLHEFQVWSANVGFPNTTLAQVLQFRDAMAYCLSSKIDDFWQPIFICPTHAQCIIDFVSTHAALRVLTTTPHVDHAKEVQLILDQSTVEASRLRLERDRANPELIHWEMSKVVWASEWLNRISMLTHWPIL